MNDFQLGQHEQAIKRIEQDISELKVDVRAIRDIVAEKRGERRAASVGFGAVGGSAVTILFRIMAAKLGIH